jgi:hypothetical protein
LLASCFSSLLLLLCLFLPCPLCRHRASLFGPGSALALVLRDRVARSEETELWCYFRHETEAYRKQTQPNKNGWMWVKVEGAEHLLRSCLWFILGGTENSRSGFPQYQMRGSSGNLLTGQQPGRRVNRFVKHPKQRFSLV